MWYKIWCDEKSWKVFEFQSELNKASKKFSRYEVRWDKMALGLGPCLVHPENQKVFKISYHIESFDTCMKY